MDAPHPGVRSGPGAVRLVTVAFAVVLVGLAGIGCGSDATTATVGHGTAAGRGSGATAPKPSYESGSDTGSVLATGSEPTSSARADSTRPDTIATSASSAAPGPPKPTVGPAVPTTAAPPGGRDMAVASTTIALVDSSRPTVSRGRQVASTRSLTTIVTYPAAGGPFPLIVFAHGYQLGPSNYSRIIKVIAAGGYVVAAPSFPLADAAVAGANLDRGDIPNQSGDLSFVISQLTGANVPGSLAGKIDAQRIGAVGHSDGADTVLDLGYFPGRMDPRVRAVAALSADALTGAGGSVGAAPLLITHGDHDSIVPYSNGRSVFAQVHSHRFFMTLVGGDHLPPVQGAAPWAGVLDRAILDLLDRYVGGRAGSDAQLLADGSVNGVASLQQAG